MRDKAHYDLIFGAFHIGCIFWAHNNARACFDMRRHHDADTIELRSRELRLLEVFVRHQGQILSKGQLMDRLFSYDAEITENAIEVYVGRLRRRIDGTDIHIETVRGIGYRMEVKTP